MESFPVIQRYGNMHYVQGQESNYNLTSCYLSYHGLTSLLQTCKRVVTDKSNQK